MLSKSFQLCQADVKEAFHRQPYSNSDTIFIHKHNINSDVHSVHCLLLDMRLLFTLPIGCVTQIFGPLVKLVNFLLY